MDSRTSKRLRNPNKKKKIPKRRFGIHALNVTKIDDRESEGPTVNADEKYRFGGNFVTGFVNRIIGNVAYIQTRCYLDCKPYYLNQSNKIEAGDAVLVELDGGNIVRVEKLEQAETEKCKDFTSKEGFSMASRSTAQAKKKAKCRSFKDSCYAELASLLVKADLVKEIEKYDSEVISEVRLLVENYKKVQKDSHKVAINSDAPEDQLRNFSDLALDD